MQHDHLLAVQAGMGTTFGPGGNRRAMNYRRGLVLRGGDRPDEGRKTDEAGSEALATMARPASARLTWPRAGCAPVSSADVPTWQTPQCVLDLIWQARSWCPNGRVASAATYAAMTNLRITPSRRREVPT